MIDAQCIDREKGDDESVVPLSQNKINLLCTTAQIVAEHYLRNSGYCRICANSFF